MISNAAVCDGGLSAPLALPPSVFHSCARAARRAAAGAAVKIVPVPPAK